MCHPFQEKRFGLILAAVPIWRCDKLLRLWHSEGSKKTGKDRLESPTQPDIEKIGEISVAYVVVIRWVGRATLSRCQFTP
jgi:hypothetical protein